MTAPHEIATGAGDTTADRRVDAILALALLIPSLAIRRLSLPRDGIGGDDGWVVAGAKGDLGDILDAGLSHPGFTAYVKAWLRFVSESPETTTLPLFVISLVTPSVLFLALRRCGFGRPAAIIAGTMMAVAPAHVVFSGRVKPYVIEALLVFVLGLLVLHLARAEWTWRTVAWWVPSVVIAATFSSFLLVSSAVAMLVLTAWADGDRPIRLTALFLQGGLQLALLLTTRSNYDTSRFAEWWADPPSEGKVETFINPVEMIEEIGGHLRHLGAAAVQGGAFWSVALVLVAVVALAAWSRGRPQSPMAQYFGLLIVVAFVGGLLGQVPFGARLQVDGTRASIWLIPSLLVGLAMAVDSLTNALTRDHPGRRLPLAVSAAAIGITVIAAGSGVRPSGDESAYTHVGTRSANELVQSLAGPDDTIITNPFTWFSQAAEPGIDVVIERDDQQLMGFFPQSATERVWVQYGDDVWDRSIEQLEARVAGSRRVVFHDAALSVENGGLAPILDALAELGFAEIERQTFGPIVVIALERAGGEAA